LFRLERAQNLGLFGQTRGVLDWKQKTISTLGDSFDKTRAFRVVPQGVTDFSHGDAQAVVELNEGILWPEPLPHFFAGNNLAW
jgi:hypothetical protein